MTNRAVRGKSLIFDMAQEANYLNKNTYSLIQFFFESAFGK